MYARGWGLHRRDCGRWAADCKIQHHLWKELIVIDGDEGEEFDEFEDPEDFPEEFDYEPEFDEGEGFWRV